MKSFVQVISVVFLVQLALSAGLYQSPPSSIVIPSGVEYVYDPTDYLIEPTAVYTVGDKEFAATKSVSTGNLSTTLGTLIHFQMPENQFGNWDLNKPSAFLYNINATNYAVYWKYAANNSAADLLNIDTDVKVDVTFANDITKCLHLSILDANNLLISCSIVNGTAFNSSIVYKIQIDSTKKSATINKLTQSSSMDNWDSRVNADSTINRKVIFHNEDGSNKKIYRLAPNYESDNNAIEVFRFDGSWVYYSVISNSTFNWANFSPVDLAVIAQNIYILDAKTNSLIRTSVTLDTPTVIQVPDTVVSLRVLNDVYFNHTGITVVVAGLQGVYLYDFTNPAGPYLLASQALGTTYQKAQVKALIGASQDFINAVYYNASTANTYVILRKQRSTFLYKTLSHQKQIVDGSYEVANNYVLLRTPAELELTQLVPIRDVYKHEAASSVNVQAKSNSASLSYTQAVDVASSISGVFWNQAFNVTQVLPLPNNTNNTFHAPFPLAKTLSEPSQFTSQGDLLGTVSKADRVHAIPFESPSGQSINHIQVNPYNPLNFVWVYQRESRFASKVCDFTVSTAQGQITGFTCGNEEYTTSSYTLQQAAVVFSPVTKKVAYIGYISTTSSSTGYFYTPTWGSSNSVSYCERLVYSKYGGAAFCYSSSGLNIIDLTYSGSFLTYRIVAGDLNLDTLNITGIESSPYYENVVFVKQATEILIVKYKYCYNKDNAYEILSRISNLPQDFTFTVSENKIIVSHAPSTLYHYDITNIRNPIAVNNNRTISWNFESIPGSSGSRFVLVSNSSNSYQILDTAVPDYTVANIPIQLNTPKNILPGNGYDIFVNVNNNNVTMQQVFHDTVLTIPIKVQGAAYVESSCVSMMFSAVSTATYKVCVQAYTPKLLVPSTVTPANAFDLSGQKSITDKMNYTVNVRSLFNGPLDGKFTLAAQLDNETSMFSISTAHSQTTTSFTLSTAGAFYAAYNNSQLLITGNDYTSSLYRRVYSVPYTAGVANSSVQLEYSGAYNCSHVSAWDNYTYLTACKYIYSSTDYKPYVLSWTNSTKKVETNFDTVSKIQQDTNGNVYVLGTQNSQTLLGRADGALVWTAYDLSGMFTAINASIIDFAFAQDTAANKTAFVFLDTSFGVRVAVLDANLRWTSIISTDFTSSPVLSSVPKTNWVGLTATCTLASELECKILLIQNDGPSYYVSWNTAGFKSILGKFNPYPHWSNTGRAFWTSTRLFLATKFPQADVTYIYNPYAPPSNNSGVAAYDINLSSWNGQTLDAIGVVQGYGAFGDAESPNSVNVLNWDVNGKYNVTTAKFVSDLNIDFTGNASLVKSQYIEITAYGPNEGKATTKVTVYTQSFFARNFWTIVIIIAAVVILGAAGGAWVKVKKGKAAADDVEANNASTGVELRVK